MPIIDFIVTSSGSILPLPLVLFICDMLVTTFVRIAFGTTSGFFRPRVFMKTKGQGKVSLHSILEGSVYE